MNRYASVALLIAVLQANAYSATGTLGVYDDADLNGFNHFAAACGSNYYYFETTVVHGGTTAIALSKLDNNGIGWATPSTYSASSDYDSLSFWVNAGDTPTTLTSLAIDDSSFDRHFLHLEDLYGGPLPANTWIHLQVPFSSPFFITAFSTPPESVTAVCIINHSSGTQTTFLYVDDVTLRGADIFRNGFEP
jgi:hypothetical protein